MLDVDPVSNTLKVNGTGVLCIIQRRLRQPNAIVRYFHMYA